MKLLIGSPSMGPSATKNLFEKRFLDLQKLLFRKG